MELRPSRRLAALQELCEENYRKLRQLIPALPFLSAGTVLLFQADPKLRVEVVERSRYTLLLAFNFRLIDWETAEPALKVRVYLDVGMAEVVRDLDRRPPRYPSREPERSALRQKWRLNHFFSRWLDHRLQLGDLLEAVEQRV